MITFQGKNNDGNIEDMWWPAKVGETEQDPRNDNDRNIQEDFKRKVD